MCEARVLHRIEPLSTLAAMAMNGELTGIDGMDQAPFLQIMRWAHGLAGATEI